MLSSRLVQQIDCSAQVHKPCRCRGGRLWQSSQQIHMPCCCCLETHLHTSPPAQPHATILQLGTTVFYRWHFNSDKLQCNEVIVATVIIVFTILIIIAITVTVTVINIIGFSAPTVWNSIPQNIRLSSIGSFKRNLKTYLFSLPG